MVTSAKVGRPLPRVVRCANSTVNATTEAVGARMTQPASAQIGVTGLAVMGRNLARNLARHGHTVAVHNRTYERTRTLVEQHGHEGAFVPSESVQEFVASLARP